MILDLIISYDLDNLTELSIRDNSDFDGTEVNAVRFLFKVLEYDNEPTNQIESFFEYEVVSPFSLNGKSYVAGNIVYFIDDYTISGLVKKTGRYGEVQSWLPSSVEPLLFVPSQTGYTTTEQKFQDKAFELTYEIYSTLYNAGSVPNGKYIVRGSGQVSSGGVTAKGGEIITVTSGSFSNVSGVNSLCKYEDELVTGFSTKAESYKTVCDYIDLLCDPNNVTNLATIQFNYLQCSAILDSLLTAEETYSFDLEEVQACLDKIKMYSSKISRII